MVYGPPFTASEFAVAGAPVLFNVTLEIVLPFSNPESVNSVPANVTV